MSKSITYLIAATASTFAMQSNAEYLEEFRKEIPNIIIGWERPISNNTRAFQAVLTNIESKYKTGDKQCLFKVSIDKEGKLSVLEVDTKSRRSSCEKPFKALLDVESIELEKPSTFLKHASIALAEELSH
ncbi:MAG: hypothetical protein HWE19_16745 [Vibrionaceae bacterium]|nr:hypothetical protein [Vibrionaceae bacterium]